jgi:polyisoprenoid-binding protein YceI
MKNGKLKGKDFFNVKQDPAITFLSKKIVQTGPDSFEIDGDFTIRGVTKPEKLTLTVTGAGTGSGAIKGTMAFDRKDYGMSRPRFSHRQRAEPNRTENGIEFH